MTRKIMLIKKRYFSYCVVLITVVVSAVAVAQDRPAADVRDAKESDLIAVLHSNAPQGDKAIACKQLAIYGTEQAIPALAPLLADEELASWARIALEAIPGPVADIALRVALDRLQGRLLIGTINSISVRRDVRAVEPLVQKLDDSNTGVASAAAVALGHIGGEQAARALTQSLADAPADVRSAAAEGCILCAEQLLASNRTADAVKLYDTVREADVSEQRHLEAIRGAILARRSAGIPLLIEQLGSQDKERLGVGLRTARELPGRDVTEALALELDRLSSDRRPLLLLALSDRNDSAVLPAVLKATQSGPKELRITAINILIRLGDVSCVQILLDAAVAGDTELEEAATETLIRLRGKEVDSDLLTRLPEAKGGLQQILIKLAGQRQISEAAPAVVASLGSTDTGIRAQAVETIGIIGEAQEAADLVRLLPKIKSSSERSDVRKALLGICGRCGKDCIPHLLPLTGSRDNELHAIGLRALAVVGGPEALAAVKSAIKRDEPAIQDEAVRILSTWPNNWPEDDAAGQELEALAKSTGKMSHQVLGMRGYLQYITGNKKLGSEQKVTQVKDALSYIKRPEERRQAIAVLGEAPSASALELLTKLTEDPAVVEEVYSAMTQIAGREVPGISRDRRRQVLQTVVDKSRNNGTRQRAQRALGRIR
jgi:HEAT repeat protein